MSTAVQSILRSYEALPDIDKRELAYEILQRSLQFSFPPVSDEELVLNAEGLFLEFEQRESGNDEPHSRRSVVG